MATYSGNQFLVYVGLHDGVNFGVETQEADGSLHRWNLDTVNDIDFSGGVIQEYINRTGQKISREEDVFTTRNGGTYSWAFDWLVDSEEILQFLVKSSVEATATGLINITGAKSHATDYVVGSASANTLQVCIVNPDASETRVLHSAVVTDLTLTMDSGTNGGRLRASGTLWSGFRPVIGTNAVTDGSTASNTDFNQGLFDCHAIEIATDQVTCKSFSFTISHPAARVGFGILNSNDGEPLEYIRNRMEITGSINVKMDNNTVSTQARWLAGTSHAILVGDEGTSTGSGATKIFFEFPTVKYTGHNIDLGAEDGVFIELPFTATATGTNKLMYLKLT
tara:strand:- start:1294 stop:2304 length:1011 start_codon:yes stop_codon:yes gene_type:complete